MKKEREIPLEEFKFHYHLGNSVGSSDKYFMAHDLDEASEMFEYACTKGICTRTLPKWKNGIVGKKTGSPLNHSLPAQP